MKSDDNKNLPKIIENSGLALHKTRNLLSITDKILANKTLVIDNSKQEGILQYKCDGFSLLELIAAVMEIVFELGCVEFKENAKSVIDFFRWFSSEEIVDLVTLNHLKGMYIGMRDEFKGVTPEHDVISIKSIEDIYSNDSQLTNQQLNFILKRFLVWDSNRRYAAQDESRKEIFKNIYKTV